jgi:hypothetical protein
MDLLIVFGAALVGVLLVAPFYGALYELGYRLGEWLEG